MEEVSENILKITRTAKKILHKFVKLRSKRLHRVLRIAHTSPGTTAILNYLRFSREISINRPIMLCRRCYYCFFRAFHKVYLNRPGLATVIISAMHLSTASA